MGERVKSYYCEVCGEQRRFSKQTKSRGGKMLSRGYDDMNPLAAASGGVFKLGGAAMNAAKSYRCTICGSKKGTKA
jgi:hypothetical protein